MIRKGFVGLAGAVVVAAFLGQALVIAQNTAATKAPAKSTDQKAPATKSNPDAKTTPATKADQPEPATPAKGRTPSSATASGGSGAVPATTPTQQPASGPAEDPKVSPGTIGSIHIPKKVMADGKPLPAGTYTMRLTDQTGAPVTGQTTSQERWVEFLQGGQVKGREMATVLTNTDVKTIAKQGVPASGAPKVETLIGNEYLRVWFNKNGTNYLVHLPNS